VFAAFRPRPVRPLRAGRQREGRAPHRRLFERAEELRRGRGARGQRGIPASASLGQGRRCSRRLSPPRRTSSSPSSSGESLARPCETSGETSCERCKLGEKKNESSHFALLLTDLPRGRERPGRFDCRRQIRRAQRRPGQTRQRRKLVLSLRGRRSGQTTPRRPRLPPRASAARARRQRFERARRARAGLARATLCVEGRPSAAGQPADVDALDLGRANERDGAIGANVCPSLFSVAL